MGRGFADFVYVPKPEYVTSYPALVVELKWKKSAQTAIQQIREKKYPESLLQYTGDILIVGINYDKDSKKHECLIEKYEKKWHPCPLAHCVTLTWYAGGLFCCCYGTPLQVKLHDLFDVIRVRLQSVWFSFRIIFAQYWQISIPRVYSSTSRVSLYEW